MATKWYTAERVVKVSEAGGDVQVAFEAGVYLGVDNAGVIRERCLAKPEGEVLIHDLGHVLLSPVRVGLLGAQSRVPRERDGLRDWAWERVEEGYGAFLGVDRMPGVGLRDLEMELGGMLLFDEGQAVGEGRRVLRDVAGQAGVHWMGGLDVGDVLDLVIWDLDDPKIKSLDTDAKCERIVKQGGRVTSVWFNGNFSFCFD